MYKEHSNLADIHHTSSLTVTWVLKHLADRPDIQAKLRSEIRAAQKQAVEEGKEELDADEVMALPYLDAVLVSPSIAQVNVPGLTYLHCSVRP